MNMGISSMKTRSTIAVFATIMVLGAINASATLINGGFEDAFNQNPPNGWDTETSTYWKPITDLPGNPNGATTSSKTAYEGHYYIRRTMFTGTEAGSSFTFASDAYTVAALPTGTDQLTLDLGSYAAGQTGNFHTIGGIDF